MGSTWADTVRQRIEEVVKKGEELVGDLGHIGEDVAKAMETAAPVIEAAPQVSGPLGGAEDVVKAVLEVLTPLARKVDELYAAHLPGGAHPVVTPAPEQSQAPVAASAPAPAPAPPTVAPTPAA